MVRLLRGVGWWVGRWLSAEEKFLSFSPSMNVCAKPIVHLGHALGEIHHSRFQMKWKSNEQEEVVMTFPSHSHSHLQRTSHQGLTVGQACWVSQRYLIYWTSVSFMFCFLLSPGISWADARWRQRNLEPTFNKMWRKRVEGNNVVPSAFAFIIFESAVSHRGGYPKQ